MPKRRAVQAAKNRRMNGDTHNGKRERIPSRISPPKYNRADLRYISQNDSD